MGQEVRWGLGATGPVFSESIYPCRPVKDKYNPQVTTRLQVEQYVSDSNGVEDHRSEGIFQLKRHAGSYGRGTAD